MNGSYGLSGFVAQGTRGPAKESGPNCPSEYTGSCREQHPDNLGSHGKEKELRMTGGNGGGGYQDGGREEEEAVTRQCRCI